MKQMRCFFNKRLFLGVAVLLCSTLLNAERDWRANDGRTLVATLIDYRYQEVLLERSYDRKQFWIKLSQLAPEDRLYAEQWQRQREKDGNAPDTLFVWPNRIGLPRDYNVTGVDDAEEKLGYYAYRTNHFEFRSPEKLSRELVKDFGAVFEATFAAVAALPLRFEPPLPAGGHFVVELYATYEDYIAGGGIPGSGGVFKGSTGVVKVPYRSLGLKKTSSSYTWSDESRHHILVHEVTHQVLADWNSRLPVWVVEGIAEFMEHTPYKRGEFDFREREEAGELFAQDELDMLKLSRLFEMTHDEWSDTFTRNSFDVTRLYRSAYLLMLYFCQYDGETPGQGMYLYLQSILKGESEVDARKHLLRERTLEELARDVERAMRREGLDVEL